MPIDNPGVDGGGTPKLRALTAVELLAADIPERRIILDPILSTKSLVLLYGPRGVGKSFLALGIAWAAATGGRFLGWQAPTQGAWSISTARWPRPTCATG